MLLPYTKKDSRALDSIIDEVLAEERGVWHRIKRWWSGARINLDEYRISEKWLSDWGANSSPGEDPSIRPICQYKMPTNEQVEAYRKSFPKTHDASGAHMSDLLRKMPDRETHGKIWEMAQAKKPAPMNPRAKKRK